MSSATAGPSPPPQAAAAPTARPVDTGAGGGVGTFRFLDGRVQASVEMPRRTPDMSIPGAALRAVLRGRWARESHRTRRRCRWTAPTRWAMHSAQAHRAGWRCARYSTRCTARRSSRRRTARWRCTDLLLAESTCCSSLKRTFVRPSVWPIDGTAQRRRAAVSLARSLRLAKVGHRQQLESMISCARVLGHDSCLGV